MAEGKQTAGARSSRAWRIAGLALAGLLVLAGCAGISGEKAQGEKGPPKYILVLFADGAGIAHFELGRMVAERIYKEDFLLTDVLMRDGAVGLMTTHSAEFLTTDSAAAGTGQPFFAFLETENLDTASHNTDIAGVVHDLRAFDRALRVAYDFYRRHRDETLLLVVADHETGGLSITSGPKGADGPGRGEWVDPGERELRMILSIRCSLREAERRLGKEPRPQQLDGVMADCFPGFELPEDVRAAIAGGRPLEPNLSTRPVQHLLGLMVARNTLVRWGSAHHTAQPVPVVAIGVGAGAFRGYYDNTDFARKLLSILGEGPN